MRKKVSNCLRKEWIVQVWVGKKSPLLSKPLKISLHLIPWRKSNLITTKTSKTTNPPLTTVSTNNKPTNPKPIKSLLRKPFHHSLSKNHNAHYKRKPHFHRRRKISLFEMRSNKYQSWESKLLKRCLKDNYVRSRLPKRWVTTVTTLAKIKNFLNNPQNTLKMANFMNAVKAVADSLIPMWLLNMKRSAKKCSSKNVKCSTRPLKDKSKHKASTSPHNSVTQWTKPKSNHKNQLKTKVKYLNGNSKALNYELASRQPITNHWQKRKKPYQTWKKIH